MRIKEQRKRKKRRRIGICIFLVVLMLFALAALIVVKVFTVQNVVVEGNSLYSADQIKNMVLDDDYSWNSLYVDLKYRFPAVLLLQVLLSAFHRSGSVSVLYRVPTPVYLYLLR